jgi:hypothetical protein
LDKSIDYILFLMNDKKWFKNFIYNIL